MVSLRVCRAPATPVDGTDNADPVQRQESLTAPRRARGGDCPTSGVGRTGCRPGVCLMPCRLSGRHPERITRH